MGLGKHVAGIPAVFYSREKCAYQDVRGESDQEPPDPFSAHFCIAQLTLHVCS